MKTLISSLLAIILVISLVGCSGSPDTTQDQSPASTYQEPEKIVVEEPEPVKVVPKSKTPDQVVSAPEPEDKGECTSTLEDHDMDIIQMTYDGNTDNFITRDAEGFTFRFFPIDEDTGEIVPVTGNIGISIYSTEDDNTDGIDRGTLIYQTSRYIKKENVMPDCAPQPIRIDFDDIMAQSKYEWVTEDDKGYLFLSFKRTGSQQLYEFEFEPYNHGLSVLP